MTQGRYNISLSMTRSTGARRCSQVTFSARRGSVVWERVLMSVMINDRVHRFRYSSDATIAFCQTLVGARSRLLWDQFEFAHCDERAYR
jgi:hypothetical protein